MMLRTGIGESRFVSNGSLARVTLGIQPDFGAKKITVRPVVFKIDVIFPVFEKDL